MTFKGSTLSGQAGTTSQPSSQGSYSFFVQFPNGCVLATSRCEVDVSEKNVVLVMEKEEGFQSTWEKFDVGLNPYQTQVHIYNDTPSLSFPSILLTLIPLSHPSLSLANFFSLLSGEAVPH